MANASPSDNRLRLIQQDATLGELTLEFGVNRESFGRTHRGPSDLNECGAIDTGLRRRRVQRDFNEGHTG